MKISFVYAHALRRLERLKEEPRTQDSRALPALLVLRCRRKAQRFEGDGVDEQRVCYSVVFEWNEASSHPHVYRTKLKTTCRRRRRLCGLRSRRRALWCLQASALSHAIHTVRGQAFGCSCGRFTVFFLADDPSASDVAVERCMTQLIERRVRVRRVLRPRASIVLAEALWTILDVRFARVRFVCGTDGQVRRFCV